MFGIFEFSFPICLSRTIWSRLFQLRDTRAHLFSRRKRPRISFQSCLISLYSSCSNTFILFAIVTLTTRYSHYFIRPDSGSENVRRGLLSYLIRKHERLDRFALISRLDEVVLAVQSVYLSALRLSFPHCMQVTIFTLIVPH